MRRSVRWFTASTMFAAAGTASAALVAELPGTGPGLGGAISTDGTRVLSVGVGVFEGVTPGTWTLTEPTLISGVSLGAPWLGGLSPDGTRQLGVDLAPTGMAAAVQTGGSVVGLAGPPVGALATACSADNTAVVGYGHNQDPVTGLVNTELAIPMRWTSGVPEQLPQPAGALTGAIATDVSASGAVIVGRGFMSGFAAVYRWTSLGVETLTGAPAGWLLGSSGQPRVSADGATVVCGMFNSLTEQTRAATWTEAVGGELLPDHPTLVTIASEALGVNADGTVVVGAVTTAASDVAVIWRRGPSGWTVQTVGEALSAAGGVVPPGMVLLAGLDVSADGRRLIVSGQSPAFIGQLVVDLTPEPIGACCRGSICTIDLASSCVGPGRRFVGIGSVCNAPGNRTTPCCKADFNQNSIVNIDDIFLFLNVWFQSELRCDYNDNGVVNIDDIFLFLNGWFSGC